jgi:hypothetical protein
VVDGTNNFNCIRSSGGGDERWLGGAVRWHGHNLARGWSGGQRLNLRRNRARRDDVAHGVIPDFASKIKYSSYVCLRSFISHTRT